MKFKNSCYPLVKMPSNVQVILYLIKEELKSRKLFHALHEVGLDDCYFQPNLDVLILQHLGLDGSDESFNIYNNILERRSRKIDANQNSIMKQALKAYQELVVEKKKLKHKDF